MRDLAAGLDALDDAVVAAGAFVANDILGPIEQLAAGVRTRLGFLGETVVVALAGGTGSGKSSLLNALAEDEVSRVGPVRPTTAEPVAWIPANPEPGLVRMLDALGIERRSGHRADFPLALIDLPDYDSVEFEHRATVERLVPEVDAVIWVLDPQKYSDRALHHDYLVPLADYQEQFLFVLNQTDRLTPAGLAAVLDDLGRRLESEGFADPMTVTTAARPAGGGPPDIAALQNVLGSRFEAKQTAMGKLAVDLRRAHHDLVTAVGQAGVAEALSGAWDRASADVVTGLADVLAGPEAALEAARLGERLAVSRAAGPLGRLGALLRRSRLGRALGARPDEVRAAHWWQQPGLERILGAASRAVTDVSLALGGQAGRDLRSGLGPGRLETELRASVEGARHAVGDLPAPEPRRWWGAIGFVQLMVFVGLVAGLVWLWVDGVERGSVPWNLVLVGGTAVVAGLLTWLIKASGRRAGRRRARLYRSDLEAALGHQIDERIGAQVGQRIASRRRLGEALDRLAEAIRE